MSPSQTDANYCLIVATLRTNVNQVLIPLMRYGSMEDRNRSRCLLKGKLPLSYIKREFPTTQDSSGIAILSDEMSCVLLSDTLDRCVCRFAWWKYRNDRASPEQHEGPPHPPADALRMNDETYAGEYRV